jgi:hypothetical protein
MPKGNLRSSIGSRLENGPLWWVVVAGNDGGGDTIVNLTGVSQNQSSIVRTQLEVDGKRAKNMRNLIVGSREVSGGQRWLVMTRRWWRQQGLCRVFLVWENAAGECNTNIGEVS